MTVRKRFVAEITLTVSADGSPQTFYVSSDGFTTLPTDTPANTYIPGTLKNAGTVERTLFTGPRITGPITPNFGNIVILNPEQDEGEGLYDAWAGYGASGGRVVVRWGDETAAYPDGYVTVYIAYVHSLLADTGEITLRLRDRMQLFDKPLVSEGFAGTGGLEGNGGISKLKQWVADDPGFIEPILVDYVKQIYFVQSTGTWVAGLEASYSATQPVNPFDVYENGVRIARATSSYASEAEILSAAPAPGEVKLYYGSSSTYIPGWKNGPVYFRLGTPPVGELRVFPQGAPNDAIFSRYGSTIGSFNSAVLAVMAGVAREDIDASSALSVTAVLVNDNRTFLEILSDQALCYQGWFGFTRSDIFRAGRLLDPEGASIYYGINEDVGYGHSTPSTSIYTFTSQDIQGFQRVPISGMEAPIHSVNAAFGDTFPSQISEAAHNSIKDYLTRTPKYWAASGASSETLLANPGALSASVEGHSRFFQNNFTVRLWMERYFVLYGGRRNFYSFSCQMSPELLALDLHDVVTLQHHRFGLSAGKKHRIAGMTVDCSTGVPTIKFLLWGGERGRYTGTTNTEIPSGGGGSGTPAEVIEKQHSLLGDFTQVFYGTVETTDPGGDTSGLSIESLGLFTQLFYGEVLYDPYFSSVVLLVQGGTNGSTTIQDQTTLYGDTATINAGAAFDNSQQVFGHNMIGATHMLPDITAFTSFGVDSRFTRASSEEWTAEIYCRWNSLQNTTSSGLLLSWYSFSGNLLTLKFYGNSGQLALINGSTNVDNLTTLSADTTYFIQATYDSSNNLTIDVDGVEVYSDTGSSSNGAGTYSMFIGATPAATNTATSAWWVGPARITKGVARPRGSVPLAEFPLS